MKVAHTDAHGAVAIFRHPVKPMSAPPLHRHSREDEWFYVLDGEITLEIDGSRTILHSGDSAYSPRGTAHAYQNFGNTTAEIMTLVTPGSNFNQFFEELSLFCNQQSAPDQAGMGPIAKKYGIEFLGPPLT